LLPEICLHLAKILVGDKAGRQGGKLDRLMSRIPYNGAVVAFVSGVASAPFTRRFSRLAFGKAVAICPASDLHDFNSIE
jgi:hypothetical protein